MVCALVPLCDDLGLHLAFRRGMGEHAAQFFPVEVLRAGTGDEYTPIGHQVECQFVGPLVGR